MPAGGARAARRPLLIGLTGGIGSGKSSVAAMLASLGAAVVDADAIARAVVEPGEPALARLVEAFGPGILRPDGTLDRRALGRRVFGDDAARKTLEGIVHPAIRKRTWDRIGALMAAGSHPAVVWDVPLLFEVGAEKLVDQVWVVTAPRAVRLQRLRQRDPDLSPEELERRMAAQMPLEEKAARAHVVIDNGGDLEATRRQVEAAWRRHVLREEGSATRQGSRPGDRPGDRAGSGRRTGAEGGSGC
ncbi:dephospho-CoA kinase [Thermaerobacter sp. PB12/4term]|uniref:dephospho-CoA kinase n=1 Tax=Thermaerobacter sp. PB12/4term TaxID=2293838 RepID=UPI000E32C7B8|nr:dephospho-CoA kinase [Thermaerobacter sp. PB12/4term]QIA28151.1 dephospho-CoA kinase [Thermaerobacter sp. PB12/4term]